MCHSVGAIQEFLVVEPSTDRASRSPTIAEHLLAALEDVVWRYRALALGDEHAEVYVEVIAAEVAHQLAVARSGLRQRSGSTTPPCLDY